MAKSLREKSIKQMIEKYHTKRLDHLLHSNDLKRVPVVADGNCFFTSVLESINDNQSMEQLREKLCCHMIENKEHYLSYLALNQNDESSNEEKLLLFQNEINTMMLGGNWNLSLGDCLPLALANAYNRPVRIYSSKMTTPVYDIQPNLREYETVGIEHINLAYLAMKGSEHYNGVTNFNHGMDTHTPSDTEEIESYEPSQSRESSPQSQDSVKSPEVTPHKRAKYQSPKKYLNKKKNEET